MNNNQIESLEKSKELKKVCSKIGFALFLSNIIAFGIVIVIMIFKLFISPRLITKSDSSIIGYGFICEIIRYLLIYIMLRCVPRQYGEKKDFSKKELFVFLLISMFIIVVGNFIGTAFSYLLSRGRAVNPVSSILEGNFLTVALSCCVFAPIFEELFFRKLFIDMIVPYGEKKAIIFTAFCFSLVHGNFFQMFYAFGLGLLFGYIYVKSRKITYTIALHACINFLGGLLPKLLKNLPGIWIKICSIVEILVAIIGMVLFLKKRSKFTLYKTDEMSAKEKYLQMLLNVGMVLFVSMYICFILLNLTIFSR